jgi:hypothetical protein
MINQFETSETYTAVRDHPPSLHIYARPLKPLGRLAIANPFI